MNKGLALAMFRRASIVKVTVFCLWYISLRSLMHVPACHCQDLRTTLCAARQYVQLCTQQFCCRFTMQLYCILQCINLEVLSAADCIFRLTESILKIEAVHYIETSEHSATSRCRTQDNTVTCASISVCNDQNTLRLGQGAPRF
jgi:hypothetical protein